MGQQTVHLPLPVVLPTGMFAHTRTRICNTIIAPTFCPLAIQKLHNKTRNCVHPFRADRVAVHTPPLLQQCDSVHIVAFTVSQIGMRCTYASRFEFAYINVIRNSEVCTLQSDKHQSLTPRVFRLTRERVIA